MKVIEASRDLPALEKYMSLFIEESASAAESQLEARRRTWREAAAWNPARIEQMNSRATAIPHAFELWIGHLGWLDRVAAGLQFTLDDLTAEEARGLALLRHARERFWHTHSACPRCQSVNLRHASFCGSCGAEFG